MERIKHVKKITHILLFLSLSYVSIKAQSPGDATMMSKGQVCVAAIWSNETWDKYWEGKDTKVNGNIGTFKSNAFVGMVNFGLSKRLNFLAGLPYVSNKVTAGQIQNQKGIQNLSLLLKASLLKTEIKQGEIAILTTVGGNFPVGSYIPDAPYALGLGCSEFSIKPIVQFKHNTGIFLRANGSYAWRGTSKLERDYYFTTTGYYSDKVAIPNAIDYEFTLGYLGLSDKLKIELNYSGFDTQGGFDIRKHDGGFPSNEIDYTRIGGSIKYWLPWVKGLGVEVFAKNTLTGRNVGQSNNIGAAVNYFFNVMKEKKETENN